MAAAKLGKSPLLGHLARGTHEAGPGNARQRTTDADPAHAQIGRLRDGKTGSSNQEIDRLRKHRLHDRRGRVL